MSLVCSDHGFKLVHVKHSPKGWEFFQILVFGVSDLTKAVCMDNSASNNSNNAIFRPVHSRNRSSLMIICLPYTL